MPLVPVQLQNRKTPACVIRIEEPGQHRPVSQFGVHYGTEHPILIFQKSTRKRLVWNRGGAYWSGMSGNMYCPTSLELWWPKVAEQQNNGAHDRVGHSITEGGRFSKALAQSVKAQIDEFFGCDVDVSCLSLKRTMVIE